MPVERGCPRTTPARAAAVAVADGPAGTQDAVDAPHAGQRLEEDPPGKDRGEAVHRGGEVEEERLEGDDRSPSVRSPRNTSRMPVPITTTSVTRMMALAGRAPSRG